MLGQVVVALYDYAPAREDEIALSPGLELEVLEDNGEWLRGKPKGAFGTAGWFPATYVQLTTNKPPPPSRGTLSPSTSRGNASSSSAGQAKWGAPRGPSKPSWGSQAQNTPSPTPPTKWGSPSVSASPAGQGKWGAPSGTSAPSSTPKPWGQTSNPSSGNYLSSSGASSTPAPVAYQPNVPPPTSTQSSMPQTPAAQSSYQSGPVDNSLYPRLARSERRKDEMTKENFYLFVIETSPSSAVYRRLNEFRSLHVKLEDNLGPTATLPELPVRESFFTNYSVLLEELTMYWNSLRSLGLDRNRVVQEFLKETTMDKVFAEIPASSSKKTNAPKVGSPPSGSMMAKAAVKSSSPPARSASPPTRSTSPPPTQQFVGRPGSISCVLIGKIKIGSGLERHYEYIIEITRDGTPYTIYRRYSEFHAMQIKLIENFPQEAGANDPNSRTLPYMPGKVLFGRSQVAEVADERMSQLGEYLEGLMRLPSKISMSPIVLEFLQPTDKDAKVAADSSNKKTFVANPTIKRNTSSSSSAPQNASPASAGVSYNVYQ